MEISIQVIFEIVFSCAEASQAQALYLGFLEQNIDFGKLFSDFAREDHSCEEEIKALISLGRAYHSYSDSLSPAHTGFQPWWGPLDGWADMGPFGYAGFVSVHHDRETMAVYLQQQASVVTSVKSEFSSDLSYILRSPASTK
jgi:hypothetical protein